MRNLMVILGLFLVLTFGCSSGGGGDGISSPSSSSNSGGSSGNDIGSCVAGIVEIGNQTWHKCNLDIIPVGTGGVAARSWCYDNDEANCAKYGRLYDWVTAMALPDSCKSKSCSSQINAKHRGICPNGWHIPSNEDWDILVTAVGGKKTAAEHLKATSGWNENGNGKDDFGFSALPGGTSYLATNDFRFIGERGYWWSATEHDASLTYYRGMGLEKDIAGWEDGKLVLKSVRCLKD